MSWVEEFFGDPIYDRDYAQVLANTERTQREADFITRELALTPQDRVLDLACGHGRHSVLIAPKVASLVGYDVTPRFVEHARKWAGELGLTNAEFVQGDMRQLPYENEFNAVYNYFTAWGYYSDEENLATLALVRRALKPGGRFLLEIIGRDALTRRFQAKDWRILDDGTVVLDERRLDVAAGRMYNRRTFISATGRRVSEFDHQLPTPDGLLAMLRRVGFTEGRVVSAPDGGPATIETFRIAIIARK